MVTDQKILYVYTRVPVIEGQNMMMLDRYGLEWEILLPGEVKDLTYMGMPIVKGNKEVGTSSESMYKRPGPLPIPTPSAPPLSILRPTMSVPRVSFREPGIPLMGVDGWRPEGSMGACQVVIRQLECQ